MSTEKILQEKLIPVFGVDSIDELPLNASLINDLQADSIDFVEIIYMIEKEFGVILKTDEIFAGQVDISPEERFDDGKLTEKYAQILNDQFPKANNRFKAGSTKMEMMSLLTIHDLANIIDFKKAKAS